MNTLGKTAVVVAVLVGVLAYMNFGTLSPCEMLRESIRRHDNLAAVLPNSLVDIGLAAQYGALSPGRCLSILLNGQGTPIATAPQNASPAQSNAVNRQTVDPAAEQEKTLRIFASDVQQSIYQMEQFNAVADVIIPKLSTAQSQYRKITSTINKYLIRQRELSANPDTFTTRNQIWIAITQGTNATEQLHNQILSGQGEFENKAVPLMRSVNEAEQNCSQYHPPVSGEATRGDELVMSVCFKQADLVVLFRQKFSTLANSYTRLENEFQNEIRKQLQIAQASSRIP
jgi:hypothetical protein